MKKQVLSSLPVEIILPPETVEAIQSAIVQCLTACLKCPPPPSPPLEQVQKEEHFNIQQLAEYLNCSLPTIHSLKREGIIPFYRLGRKIYFKKSEIDAIAYVESRFLKKKLND